MDPCSFVWLLCGFGFVATLVVLILVIANTRSQKIIT
jgi:hypothetical protein